VELTSKYFAAGEKQKREIVSGRRMTAQQTVCDLGLKFYGARSGEGEMSHTMEKLVEVGMSIAMAALAEAASPDVTAGIGHKRIAQPSNRHVLQRSSS
jgi:hypothetical protein